MEQRRQSRDEVLLNKLTEIVLKNLENEQFGVTELSREVGISRFHLHRKLKALEGKSVSQFIREIRLMEAMKMLHDDIGTASEISYRVGFASPSYFNSCFQKYYGYPPGEVKKLSVDTNVSHLKEVIDELPKTKEKHADDNKLRASEKKISREKVSITICDNRYHYIFSRLFLHKQRRPA